MKALDLFCGLGGWSDRLALEGFKVQGVEIEPEIAELYKHPVIVEDVRNLDPEEFKGFTLIVGSPPCRDFTKIPDVRYKEGNGYRITPWKEPKNPIRGLELVNTFLNFVELAEPTYWLMENVVGLTDYLEIKPRMITRLGKGMKRAFWGNFPSFFVIRDYSLEPKENIQGKLRKWERAKIPIAFSKALGKAVMSSFTNKEDPI